MTSNDTVPLSKLKIDERNHVGKPLRDKLAGLGWEIINNEMEVVGV